ncbi:cysteine dioxygenase type I [Xylariaceae sp. FL0016]|nr:cysteine dioxygenase type I [Xylariaceae sp. FL0016]
MNQFERLVTALRDALGQSGLVSEDVDVQRLTELLQTYYSDEAEWGAWALQDSTKGYTRNLVDVGNGKSNLLLLVWTPGKGSPIHSHSNSHCLMKILKGELTETRYDFPPDMTQEQYHISDGREMNVVSETIHVENQVAYMNDDLGVHRMWNRGTDFAVSLHLYTPPNIARDGCYVFDIQTGKRTHVSSCDYYSIRGNLVKEPVESAV